MLIVCPECGYRISDKAKVCSNCGYYGKKPRLSISLQKDVSIIPKFQIQFADKKDGVYNTSYLNYYDNKNLVSYFGDIKNIQRIAPQLADCFIKMASSENVLVAKTNDFIKKQILNGDYTIRCDKNGELLPTIVNSKGKYVKNFRLENKIINADIIQSLNNIQTQLALTQVLNEIEYLGQAIRDLQIEAQLDKLSLADSARDKFAQISKMQDLRLQEIAILNAINVATDAKSVLMSNFQYKFNYVLANSQKSIGEMLMTLKFQNSVPDKANDAMNALVAITNLVQTVSIGYSMLGEYGSCEECLQEFKQFIKRNGLNDRDNLISLNANLKIDKIEIVNDFLNMVERLEEFTNGNQLSNSYKSMIEEGNNNGNI